MQPIKKNPCQFPDTRVSNTSTKLILPPFGKHVIKTRQPKHREVTIFIASQADAWRKAKIKAWNGCLALAYLPWESPRQYLWTVKNLEVLIFNFLNTDLPEAQLNELALCLLQRGAVVVRYVHLNSNNKMKIFRREGASNDTTARFDA